MERTTTHGGKRMRVIINALTRMRLCTPNGHMEFDTKVAPGAWPPGLIPWFDVPNRADARRHGGVRPLVHAGTAAAEGRGLPGYRAASGAAR